MGAKWQRVVIDIPEVYGPEERLAISQEVIDFIRKQAKKGLDKNGNPYTGPAAAYSPSYVKSLDFKNAGKTKGKVDLTLSGDMLDALELLNHARGKLTIGYKNGTTENNKADGNIRGTYGTDSPNKKKARDFLGINTKDLEAKILSNYPEEDRQESKEQAKIVLEAGAQAEEAAEGITAGD